MPEDDYLYSPVFSFETESSGSASPGVPSPFGLLRFAVGVPAEAPAVAVANPSGLVLGSPAASASPVASGLGDPSALVLGADAGADPVALALAIPSPLELGGSVVVGDLPAEAVADPSGLVLGSPGAEAVAIASAAANASALALGSPGAEATPVAVAAADASPLVLGGSAVAEPGEPGEPGVTAFSTTQASLAGKTLYAELSRDGVLLATVEMVEAESPPAPAGHFTGTVPGDITPGPLLVTIYEARSDGPDWVVGVGTLTVLSLSPAVAIADPSPLILGGSASIVPRRNPPPRFASTATPLGPDPRQSTLVLVSPR